MSGTSQVAGYIPAGSAPLDDAGIADALSAMIVGLTGLDPTLVRPRWQPQPPTQPPATTSWCAIGVTEFAALDYPQVIHHNNSDLLYRLERITVLATFYGPAAGDLSGQLRDGVYVSQNFWTLSQAGLKLRGIEDMIHVPELINAQYIDRYDLSMSFMRLVERTYPVLDISSAVVPVFADSGLSCVEIITQ